jgi:hypothetical protein
VPSESGAAGTAEHGRVLDANQPTAAAATLFADDYTDGARLPGYSLRKHNVSARQSCLVHTGAGEAARPTGSLGPPSPFHRPPLSAGGPYLGRPPLSLPSRQVTNETLCLAGQAGWELRAANRTPAFEGTRRSTATRSPSCTRGSWSTSPRCCT